MGTPPEKPDRIDVPPRLQRDVQRAIADFEREITGPVRKFLDQHMASMRTLAPSIVSSLNAINEVNAQVVRSVAASGAFQSALSGSVAEMARRLAGVQQWALPQTLQIAESVRIAQRGLFSDGSLAATLKQSVQLQQSAALSIMAGLDRTLLAGVRLQLSQELTAMAGAASPVGNHPITRFTAIADPSAVGAPRGKSSTKNTSKAITSTEPGIVVLRATSI